MKIRPLNDWVVLRPLDAEERSSGGIIIPDVAREKPQAGIVEAVGPGTYERNDDDGEEKRFIPTEVKPGQKVLYDKYMASELEINNEKILLVREAYILGVLKD
jgi:chaperonin GroES